MARSHHRHKKHHAQAQHHHAATHKQQRKAAPVIAILLGVFGIGIAYFASGTNIIAIVLGAGIGALVGYFIGNSLDKIARQK